MAGQVFLQDGDKVSFVSMMHGNIGTAKVFDEYVEKTNNGKYQHVVYENLIDLLAKDIELKLAQAYDSLILVTGKVGQGKSTFAYDLATRIDKNFDIGKNFCYTFEDAMETIKTAKAGDVIWMDEATLSANSRTSMSKENIILTQILDIIRAKGLIFIMCIPSYNSLDIRIRSERTDYVIDVRQMKFKKDEKPRRGYFLLQRVVRDNRDRAYTLPLGYGMFKDMPQDVKDVYLKIKMGSLDNQLLDMNVKGLIEGSRAVKTVYKTIKFLDQYYPLVLEELIESRSMSRVLVEKVVGKGEPL